MRPLRYKSVWLMLSGLIIVVVMVASLVPVQQSGAMPNDKLLHLLTYLVLGFWFGALYPRERFALVGLGLAALGLLIECLQLTVSYRSFELADLLADVMGAAGGLLLASTSLGGMLVLLENQLLRRD